MDAKKIIAIFMCMLMIAVIPASMAKEITPENDEENEGETGLIKTLVWGIKLPHRLSLNGKYITFFAIKIHVRTFGFGDSHVYRLNRMKFKSDWNGFVSPFFVFAIFDGTPR